MGRKYIVEIGRLERLYKASVNGNGKPNMTWLSPEVDLTPYTEPDLGALAKENFERGYRQRKAEDEKEIQEAYQRGLSDAWEAARKIQDTGGNLNWWIHNTSASEAIEKIRQYEQEQDRQARIEYNFDEIKDVLETTAKECNVSLDEIAAVLEKMRGEQDG